jgi:hypothetical protein
MTSSRIAHTFAPRSPGRIALRTNDLAIVQRASAVITELGRDLDSQLAAEPRPTERMRMLRETTNRITRTANDAIQAYRRASRAVAAELERPKANHAAASDMSVRLEAARREMLRVLEVAGSRYPWTDEPTDGVPGPTP